jgi:hypothetical protein
MGGTLTLIVSVLPAILPQIPLRLALSDLCLHERPRITSGYCRGMGVDVKGSITHGACRGSAELPKLSNNKSAFSALMRW